MQAMAPVIEMTRSSYENGLAWYLSGLLLEEDKDQANAALATARRGAIPGNVCPEGFPADAAYKDAETFKTLAAQAGCRCRRADARAHRADPDRGGRVCAAAALDESAAPAARRWSRWIPVFIRTRPHAMAVESWRTGSHAA
jgi:hypothetical protein